MEKAPDFELLRQSKSGVFLFLFKFSLPFYHASVNIINNNQKVFVRNKILFEK